MSLLQFVNHIGETVEMGDVVVIATDQRQAFVEPSSMPTLEVDLAEHIYDTAVCGIVHDLYAEHKPDAGRGFKASHDTEKTSGRGGRKRGAEISPTQAFTVAELETLDRSKIAPGQIGHLVAGGLCPVCKVDADIAPIKIGDLLTTSPTKGHAQKLLDPAKALGAVIGKALAPLKKGKGRIPVLVTLQ